MRKIAAALAFLAGLIPTLAAAQAPFPQTVCANCVIGRLGVSAGPAQAIPFARLGLVPTSSPSLGVVGTLSGSISLVGVTSGRVTVSVRDAAGTWTFKFPTTAGSNGQSLVTDGSGNTSWAAGTGTVNSGTAGQLGYYDTTAAAISGNANLTVSSGALTVGVAGSQQGTVLLSGSSSGATTLAGQTSGGGTMTFPAGSDTVATLAATQALTNKTVNKVTITAPATSSTLTIADGKTLTDTSGIGASVLLGATGGGFAAYAGASCTNQFIRSLSAAAAATCASVANTDLTNSSLTIGSTSVSLGGTAATVAGLALTAPTINGGTATALTGLGIRSTGSGAFDLTLANTENLTAGRTLTVTTNNANRTLNLSGNLTLAGAFATAGGSAITLTATGATNVTLLTSGTMAAQDVSNTFSATNIFSALNTFTDLKLSSGRIYPSSDGTTALQITKADGTTRIINVDTTNARVGINKTAGAYDLDVSGAANVGGRLTFSILDGASLAASPSTITDMTINNSPSSSNDYIGYYNAAASAWRRATIGSIAAAASGGVQNLNGLCSGTGCSIAAGFGTTVTSAGTTVTVNAGSVIPQGRLTLTSAVPVLVADVTGATTVYYTAYTGRSVPVYDGSNMTLQNICAANTAGLCELSVAMGSTWAANSNFDWFVGVDSGTVRLCSGPAWTSDTGRGTGAATTELQQINGLPSNKVSMACRYNNTTTFTCAVNQCSYVGSMRTTASTGTTQVNFGGVAAGGTDAKIYLWNNFNRRPWTAFVGESTDSWTYTSTTIRAANGSATMRATYIAGLSEDSVAGIYGATITTTATNAGLVGVAQDATNAFCGQQAFLAAGAVKTTVAARCRAASGLGLHYMSANETDANTNDAITFYGDDGTPGVRQSGLTVEGSF